MKLPLTDWVLNKLIIYLTSREGFTANESAFETRNDMITTEVQDAFGYRYEIRIRAISRTADSHGHGQEEGYYSGFSRTSVMGLVKISD